MTNPTEKKAVRRTPAPKPAPKGRRIAEQPLDDALDDTFPASDPVSAQSPAVPGDTEEKAQKNAAHRKEHEH